MEIRPYRRKNIALIADNSHFHIITATEKNSVIFTFTITITESNVANNYEREGRLEELTTFLSAF